MPDFKNLSDIILTSPFNSTDKFTPHWINFNDSIKVTEIPYKEPKPVTKHSFVRREKDGVYYIAVYKKTTVFAGTAMFGDWLDFSFNDRWMCDDLVYTLNTNFKDEYFKYYDKKEPIPKELALRMIDVIVAHLEHDTTVNGHYKKNLNKKKAYYTKAKTTIWGR